jgi:hypothetical protein
MLAKRLARHGPEMTSAALAAVLSQNATSAAVPGLVVSSTMAALAAVAGGAATTGAVSANVAVLTEGVLKTMFLKKLKLIAISALMVGALIAGGVALHASMGADPPTQEQAGTTADKGEKTVDITAMLVVIMQAPRPGVENSTAVEDQVATNMVLLSSPFIVSAAVKKGKLADLKSFAGIDPFNHIVQALTIERDSKAKNIIVVTYSSTSADDGIIVLKSLLDSFEEFLDDRVRRESSRFLEMTMQTADQLKLVLERAKLDYYEFRKTHALGLADGKARVAAIDAKAMDVELKKTEIEARLTWIESARADGGRETELALKAAEWAMRMGHDRFKGKDAEAVAAWTRSVKSELEELVIWERSVKRMKEEAQKEAHGQMENEMREKDLRKEIVRREELYDATVKNLRQLEIVHAQGRATVHILSEPRRK